MSTFFDVIIFYLRFSLTSVVVKKTTAMHFVHDCTITTTSFIVSGAENSFHAARNNNDNVEMEKGFGRAGLLLLRVLL